MPAAFIALHLLFSALFAYSALRLRPGRWTASLLAAAGLGLVVAGMAVERVADWAWSAMSLGWSDLVYFTNWTLEGVAVLLAVLWRSAPGAGARRRAVALAPVALGAAVWSYGWYFEPLPQGLQGAVDAAGLCRQTSEESCSAAAAVMLLHRHGVRASEAEMARLCLTRDRRGTSPLGLHHGVAVKARSAGLSPVLLRIADPERPTGLACPAIISVGLPYLTPRSLAERMEQYGWTPGRRHAILITAVDAAGRWVEVADPSYGIERWPTQDLRHLWDGRALALKR